MREKVGRDRKRKKAREVEYTAAYGSCMAGGPTINGGRMDTAAVETNSIDHLGSHQLPLDCFEIFSPRPMSLPASTLGDILRADRCSSARGEAAP